MQGYHEYSEGKHVSCHLIILYKGVWGEAKTLIPHAWKLKRAISLDSAARMIQWHPAGTVYCITGLQPAPRKVLYTTVWDVESSEIALVSFHTYEQAHKSGGQRFA